MFAIFIAICHFNKHAICQSVEIFLIILKFCVGFYYYHSFFLDFTLNVD